MVVKTVNYRSRKANLTINRIIESAEILFVENGLNNTSLRMITQKAGVNIASISYHFGSKEALIEEVFSLRFTPYIQNVRHYLLTYHLQNSYSINDLVIALIKPLQPLMMEDDPSRPIPFIRFCSRMLNEQHAMLHDIIRRSAQDIMLHFFILYEKLIPELNKEEIGWRVLFSIKLIFSAYNGIDVFGLHRDDPQRIHSFERVSKFLIPYLTAAMSAPAIDPESY